MKFEDFSPIQKKAITIDGNNVLVSAGAGSGKTEVLSERVLQFVKRKNNPYEMSDFLIMTFTRKAAEEMKQRIRSKLENDESLFANEQAKNVDVADIGTFDSIALNIVKKYHNVFKLSSEIKNIDSNFIKVLLRNRLIEELDIVYSQGNSSITDYIETHYRKDDKGFINFLIRIYYYFFNNNIDINKYKQNINSIEHTKTALNVASKLLVEAKQKIITALDNGGSFVMDYDKGEFKYPDDLRDRLTAFIDSDENFYLMSSALQDSKIPDLSKKKDEYSEVPFFNYYFDLSNYISSIKEELGKISESEEEDKLLNDENKELVEEILNIVSNAITFIRDYKIKNAAFEFADISNMALELLRDHDEIRNYYKKRYKMIMIDEYQDTDNKQEEFVSLISNNNVYQVGDIKQSIYRFRNANPKLFLNKFNDYKNSVGGELVELSSNFRSRPEVIDDINYIFDFIMTNNTGFIDYKGIEGHSHHLDAPNKIYRNNAENQKYNIEFLHIDDENKKLTKEESEIHYILADIVNKINSGYQVVDKYGQFHKCTYSDFAILISSSTYFDKYVEEFQKNGVPLSMIKDENIIENDFLRIFQNILKMIGYFRIYNSDITEEQLHHYLCSLARSYIFEMTDDELYVIKRDNKWHDNRVFNYFNDLVNKHADLTVTHLLDLLIKDLNLYQGFIKDGHVAHNKIYINSLIEKVNEMQNLDLSLKEIIDYFDDITEFGEKITITNSDSAKDSVSLMTVHVSKGLEFKIVYLPEMHRRFILSDSNAKENISEWGISFREEIKDSTKMTINYWVHKKLELKEIVAEKIRLLYVAMTRAREKLIIPWLVDEISEKATAANIDCIYSITSFNDVLSCVVGVKRFEYIKADKNYEFSVEIKPVEQLKFLVKSLPIYDFQIKQSNSHASKELELSTNSDILELGTKLHLAMEVMDLKHPDYSLLNDDKLVTIVKKFIASDICKNIQKGDIYHEYEFVDDTNNKVGIIDMFVVYPDYIDIVDFKTSHIDDSEYDKQLHVYKDFLAQKFNKPINMYLYSLLKGTSRKVD